MENKKNTRTVRHIHVVRDAYGRPVRKKKKSKLKKVGIAAAVIAVIVPIVLAIRAFVTSEDAKKNRKLFTKKYKKFAKKIRNRF